MQKLSGRDHEVREPTLRREQSAGSEDLSGELQAESEGPQPTESKNDAETRNDFWSVQGDFICRHHNEPRVQLYVPKGETFTIPLKYSEVRRSTNPNLDVLQEKRIEDYWNIDENRSLSDSWKGFTKFTYWKRNVQKGYMWSERRLTKILATTRADNVWLEVWTKIGKAAHKREKQEWANEKPKLDNAWRLRGIYFIDPEDGEYKDTVEHARRKLEVPMVAAMPCKKWTKYPSRFQETEAKSDTFTSIPNTKHACVVEAHESTRQRLESSLPKNHEDHIWGKG